MEVEGTVSCGRDRCLYSRWGQVDQSNCRLFFALVVGLLALLVALIVQAMTGPIETTFLAGFWRVVVPWLFGVSSVVFLICAVVVAWHLYLVKLAHDEKIARVKLLQEGYKQSHQTTLLLKEARVNNDTIKVTYGENEQVKSIEVIRASVLLEQTRIQQAARALSAPGRSQLPTEQWAQCEPVKRRLVVPGPYDLIEVIQRFPLAPDNLFLGIDGAGEWLACDPRLELCHGAFNAVSGRGKTILVRGIETQLLKTGFEVVHADIKFSLIDEKGHDYRPIARALLDQGEIRGLALPHLLVREDHIVHLLEWLAGPELMRRLALYNQGKHTYKVFFLFLEELLYLIGKYKHLGPLIAPLLSVGRSLGIKVFTVAQNYQVQNLKLNSGMRENFESAWFLGGDIHSGAALLDMSRHELETLLVENHIKLGQGVTVFRNNAVAYDARVMRGGMAGNEFVYWMLGRADNFLLPDEILPDVLDAAGLSTPDGLPVAMQEAGGLPVDEDLREAMEAWRKGVRGPRAMQRALRCTYYRAQQLCTELVEKGLVETD